MPPALLCNCMRWFGLQSEKVWQVWSKSNIPNWWHFQLRHLIRCCWTIPCPPYGFNEWCFNVQPALVAVLCHCMMCFGLQWEKFGRFEANPIDKRWGKVWQVWSKSKPKLRWCFQPQYTLSDAAEPFHVLYMDPMSDVSMCNQLLFTCLCHCMPCLGLWWE